MPIWEAWIKSLLKEVLSKVSVKDIIDPVIRKLEEIQEKYGHDKLIKYFQEWLEEQDEEDKEG